MGARASGTPHRNNDILKLNQIQSKCYTQAWDQVSKVRTKGFASLSALKSGCYGRRAPVLNAGRERPGRLQPRVAGSLALSLVLFLCVSCIAPARKDQGGG